VRGHRDLSLAVAAAILCALIALLSPWQTVSLLASLPLCLLLPGYTLTAAIFGGRAPDRPRLLLLTLAISLSVLVIGSIVLNYMPGGIRDVSWALLLVLVVLAAARGAALRRDKAGTRRRERLHLPHLRKLDATLLGVGVAAALAAMVLAQIPLSADKAEGFTSLWMLPARGGEDAMRVGVASNQQDDEEYRLVVRVAGKDAGGPRKLTVAPGEEKVLRVPIDLPAGTKPVRVGASLYRTEAPKTLFRRVSYFIPRDQAR
jgi:uncharacterized membrane protein